MAASALHSFSSFRSQAMHPPPPAQGLRQKAAIGAVEMMEETMRVLTLTELMRLSKIELCDLAARITNAFPDLPEGSDTAGAELHKRSAEASGFDSNARLGRNRAQREDAFGVG